MSKEISKPVAAGIVIAAALLIGGTGWFLTNRSSGPGGSNGKMGDPTKMPPGIMPTMQVQGSEVGDTHNARIQPIPGGMGMPPGGMPGGPPGGMPGGMPGGPPGGMPGGPPGGMPGGPPGGMPGRPPGGMPGGPPGGGAPMPGGMSPVPPKIGADGKPELPAGAPADTVVKHVENPFSKK